MPGKTEQKERIREDVEMIVTGRLTTGKVEVFFGRTPSRVFNVLCQLAEDEAKIKKIANLWELTESKTFCLGLLRRVSKETNLPVSCRTKFDRMLDDFELDLRS